MIEKVRFASIKSLRDVSLDLTRLTVLVGPNGCGKSTVLDQIDRLCRMSVPEAARQLGDDTLPAQTARAAAVRRTGSVDDMVWSGRARGGYELEIRAPAGGPASLVARGPDFEMGLPPPPAAARPVHPDR